MATGVLWFGFLFGIALNLILAYLTAKDAHQRGHSRNKWLVLVLLFGLFAIVVYLLTRNDTVVPEEERETNKIGMGVTIVSSLAGAITLMIFYFLFAGFILLPLGYPFLFFFLSIFVWGAVGLYAGPQLVTKLSITQSE